MSLPLETRETILNVDDYEPARYAKSRILRQAGYELIDVARGEEALQVVQDQRPDLVLLDVKLPDIDGYEVCRRIRADPRSAHTVVLQTSASFIDLQARLRALNGGADSYLPAPFEPEVLVASVRALLRMRRAESELSVTREAFRAMFEQAPIAIAHVARDGAWLRGNKKLAELLRLDGLPDGRFVDAVASPQRARIDLGLARLFGGYQETVTGERTLVDSHGVEHLVQLTASLVAAPHAEPYAVVLLEDIEDRRRAQLALQEHQFALRESEERFRQFADNSRDVLWVFDLRDRRYVYVSQAFEQVWGFPPELVLEDPERWVKAIPGFERAIVTSNRLQPGPPCSVLYRITRADGEQHWIDDRTFSIPDADGVVRRRAGIAQDVTHRHLAEEQRKQLLESERAARLEAERSSRLKEQFLATLSHELRTPLNAILGWTQLLRRRKLDAAQIEEGLAVIERNSRAQAVLISDLLDVNRVVAGKMRLEAARVELAQIVAAAVESLGLDARAKGVTLLQHLQAIDRPVFGDAARLQQVVWNLVSNAIKFTPAGGEVVVTLQARATSAEIAVHDTGEGISPDFLPHIFERFRQGDPSTTRRHGGLGLGLSIVRSLVELHGGRVHASSPGEGKGATFMVELPLVRGDSTAEPACEPLATDGPESATSLAGTRVLLVDDEQDAREFVRRVLVEHGAEVCSVGSASEALRAAREFVPDVLVSDIGMPGMDGYEFLRVFRAQSSADAPIPALALTAYAREEDRRRAQLEGYDGHLPKPIEPNDLVNAVRRFATRLRV